MSARNSDQNVCVCIYIYDLFLSPLKKKLISIIFFTRNSGAGNGCANFMGAWHFLVLCAEKPQGAHENPPFRGEVLDFLEGGCGGVNFIWTSRTGGVPGTGFLQ